MMLRLWRCEWVLILIILLLGCQKEDDMLQAIIASLSANQPEETQEEFQGALVLTFDDTPYAPTWLEYHNAYGIAQNWKATFFTIHDSQANTDILKILHDYGHEIANHTYGHFHWVADYMLTHTAEEYYLEHIKPWDDELVANGIQRPTSFRFPYDYLNHDVIDYLLAGNTQYNQVALANQHKFETVVLDTNIFYNCDRLSISLSIPRVGGSLSLPQIKDCMDYAKANKKAVCFFAHGLGLDPLYVEIIDYANSIGLPMMTVSELNNIAPCTREFDGVAPTIGTLSVAVEGAGDVGLSCTATDDVAVVSYDIWVDDVYRYRYYRKDLHSTFLIPNLVDGQTCSFKVKALDKYGNSSEFSNTVTATP